MTIPLPGREYLPPPARVLRAGETALLAEYADPDTVLAVTAAVRALRPVRLVDVVPAELTVLLIGTAPQDIPAFIELLGRLPAADEPDVAAAERTLEVVYDGEDLAEVAAVLGLSTQALITAHTATTWTAAFGGFAPGFAYLVAGPAVDTDPAGPPDPSTPGGPMTWDVPRRPQPRTAVPAGAVGLASRYCGVYPRTSPGGWQLIGRTETQLFDPSRNPPALLTPGTRVRFTARRATARTRNRSGGARTRVIRSSWPAAAVPEVFTRRKALPRPTTGVAAPAHGPAAGEAAASEAFEVLAPGPLSLLMDAGRPGQASFGITTSGAFDRGALIRTNMAVGNPGRAATLETVLGPLRLRALAATVVAIGGAPASLHVLRRDPEAAEIHLSAEIARERAVPLDAGDHLEIGPVSQGLRIVLAVRGGFHAVHRAGGDIEGPVLGSLSRDTLSELGPAPLQAHDVLLAGPDTGFDAVPEPPILADAGEPDRIDADSGPGACSGEGTGVGAGLGAGSMAEEIRVPVVLGPRQAAFDDQTLRLFLSTSWTVRTDSDRVGIRLDGPPLPPATAAAGTRPSEAMVPGAVQVPPAGLPIVFGPDHPATGGYPVIAVATRTGLDRLAQTPPGAVVRFVPAQPHGGV